MWCVCITTIDTMTILLQMEAITESISYSLSIMSALQCFHQRLIYVSISPNSACPKIPNNKETAPSFYFASELLFLIPLLLLDCVCNQIKWMLKKLSFAPDNVWWIKGLRNKCIIIYVSDNIKGSSGYLACTHFHKPFWSICTAYRQPFFSWSARHTLACEPLFPILRGTLSMCMQHLFLEWNRKYRCG